MMRKLLYLTMFVTFATTSLAQSSSKTDSLLNSIDTNSAFCKVWLERIVSDLKSKERYKLYPTNNIYTFLQLDTQTGMIEQVQWSLDSDNEGTITINYENLSSSYSSEPGTFELYPTQNMYQFILLDKTNGRKWHVQWGIGEKKRWIRRIY